MGNVTLTTEELQDMLNKAAKTALAELGLHDETAAQDLREIRSLLSAWRETRSTAWKTIVKLATTAVLTFIAFSVWASVKVEVFK